MMLMTFDDPIKWNIPLFSDEQGFVDDAFYFSVSDNHHSGKYALFQIQIHPVHVTLDIKNVQLPQGDFSTLLSNDVIAIETNGDFDAISVDITLKGTSGDVIVDNAVVRYEYMHFGMKLWN